MGDSAFTMPLAHSLPTTHPVATCAPQESRRLGAVFPTFWGAHTQSDPLGCSPQGQKTASQLSMPTQAHARLLTFTLNLKHADGVLQREAAELAGWECVSPLAAGGL